MEGSASWAKLAGEDGKYRMMKLESRKRGARRELDLRVCLVWRQSFFIFVVKAKKK
jgi:hypothetical protein